MKNTKPIFKILLYFSWSALFLSLSGCMSAYIKSTGGNTEQIIEKIFITDFDTAWQATLDALKHLRLEVTNREGGFIQSKWVENTAERNFIDSFGLSNAYLKAQYRFRISLDKGSFRKKNTIKVNILKEQLIERDVLEGWKPTETDSIDEKTLLYRIGRLIYIKTKIAQFEEEKSKKAAESINF